MDFCSPDPYATLVTALRSDQFPKEALENLLEEITGYIRSSHSTFYSEADDIASECVLVAYEDIEKFRGDSAFLTWVIGIAKINILRRARKQNQLPTQSWGVVPETLAGASAFEQELCDADERELFLINFEEAKLLLSEQQRQVFEMRVQGQLHSKVVAERLGITDENARQILTRASRALRSHLVKSGWGDQYKSRLASLRTVRGKAVVSAQVSITSIAAIEVEQNEGSQI